MHALQSLVFFMPESFGFAVFARRLLEGIAGKMSRKEKHFTPEENKYVEALLKQAPASACAPTPAPT